MAWPTSAFPTSLDTITDRISSNDIVADDINGVYDCLEKIEAKIGANSSAVTTSLDYLLKSTSSSNPGHKHTLANGATDVSATAAEVNALSGLTATSAELNLLDTSVAGTAVASKALVLGADKNIDILAIAKDGLKIGAGAGTAMTCTAAELNILDGVTATTAEVNTLAGVTAGTTAASKALVVDANKRLDTLVIADSGLKLGLAGGTAVTATAAELNKLSGATATTAEINTLAGVAAGTVTASKALVVDANKRLDTLVIAQDGLKIGLAGGTAVNATAAELNILHDATLTTAELNKLAGVTGGTAAASKALVVDANKRLDTLVIGSLCLGAAAGTAVTSTAAELNTLAGVAAGTVTASKALVVDANKRIDTLVIAQDGLKIGLAGGTAVNATAAELNILHDCTATAVEINKLAGVTGGTAAASKAMVLGADKNIDTLVIALEGLKIGSGAGTAVTSSAAELNILDGVTATTAEINLLDNAVAGTAVASKALALGADKNVDVLAVADLKLGAGAGTSVSATAAELNMLDGAVTTVIQTVYTVTGAVATGSTQIPHDDSIPQITEGDEYMTKAITPVSATNILKVEIVFVCADTLRDFITVALFKDATAGALAAVVEYPPAAGAEFVMSFTHWMVAGGTSAITFRVRAGCTQGGGTLTFNGAAGNRILGGVMASSITITEFKA